MLTGSVAWLLEDCLPEDRRMGRLFDLLNNDDVPYELDKLLDADKVHNRAARAAFTAFLSLSERETRPSVLASTQQHLRLFDSELIRRLTDKTSFDLDALIAGKPMSLYIIVPPARLSSYKPLLRSWLSGLLFALTTRRTLPEHRTLLLCDEIASLGRMDAFLMAATLMRGWGLTLWSFWQNPAQLELYGDQARTIVDNAGVVQLFGARNRRMAGEFAALVGGVDADEILTMAPDQQLLLIEGGHPRICRRIRYFEDPLFAGLYDPNPLFPAGADGWKER